MLSALPKVISIPSGRLRRASTRRHPCVCSADGQRWVARLGSLAVPHPQSAIPDKSTWNLLCVYLGGMLVILSFCLCLPV